MSAVSMSPLRLSLLLVSVLLSACAVQKTPVHYTQKNWPSMLHDEWFKSREDLPAILPAEQIFALSPAMTEAMDSATRRFPAPGDRMRYLVDTVFGPDFKDFTYVSGLTTPASVTFQQRGGNCLSLSIMTITMAEALGFKPHLQEVRVPLMWERRGSTDFVNRHVNVLIRRPTNITVNTLDFSRDVVLDFEPHNVTVSHGERLLSTEEISAMYYNNLGAEAYAKKEWDLAYHLYREALQHDPTFDSIWVNLAQLYNRVNQPEAAEQALRYAMQMNPNSYVAISSLQKQLQRMQRTAEAEKLERLLADLRESDPYFLLSRALDAKEKHDYRRAANSLEKAAKVAEGFEVVHRELADIYRKLGKTVAADEQLKMADNIANGMQTEFLSPKRHD